jgi:hypothetical protein
MDMKDMAYVFGMTWADDIGMVYICIIRARTWWKVAL